MVKKEVAPQPKAIVVELNANSYAAEQAAKNKKYAQQKAEAAAKLAQKQAEEAKKKQLDAIKNKIKQNAPLSAPVGQHEQDCDYSDSDEPSLFDKYSKECSQFDSFA